jgi:hypothetical protein
LASSSFSADMSARVSGIPFLETTAPVSSSNADVVVGLDPIYSDKDHLITSVVVMTRASRHAAVT